VRVTKDVDFYERALLFGSPPQGLFKDAARIGYNLNFIISNLCQVRLEVLFDRPNAWSNSAVRAFNKHEVHGQWKVFEI
jgi:hypothetical protein